jgi:SNF2 family DNA or RNA helicase
MADTIKRRPQASADPSPGPEIPLSRLNAYLRALGHLRGARTIAVGDLLTSMEDVSRRQVTEDCDHWGIQRAAQLSFAELARAVRRELHQRRRQKVLVEPPSAELPDGKALLALIRGHSDDTSARQAALLEAAYAYAEAEPQYLLSAHGDMKHGHTAFRHQLEEAQKVVEEMLSNAIVIHEVGLGKTVTGILVLIELLRRDSTLTCLVLVPSNLLDQWADELTAWTDLQVAREDGYNARALKSERYLLLSIDSAKEPHRAAILRSRRWGFVMVDEGHLLRNNETRRYRLVYALRARFRLLLTATPVHNSGYDILHQVNIVRPGHLGHKAVFAESFMRDERQIESASDLQARLATVLSQRQRQETDLVFPRRQIEAIEIQHPSDEERELYMDVLSLLRGIYRWHLGAAAFIRRPSGGEQGMSQLVLVSMLVLRELASHPLSALKTLAGPLRQRVTHLAAVTGATDDLRKLDKKLAVIVDRYASADWGAGKHKKTDELVERLPALSGRFGRVIVYVEFRETQKAIVARLGQIAKSTLRAAGVSRNPDIISYHGGLPQKDKTHQIERFRQSANAWFISMDAGGQGLNLQDGQVVVNFDFPWNPMRVEQRIGRVDRIGQRSQAVTIENYVTHGTIEEYVYRALREKLRVCEDVLGRVIPRIFQLKGVQSQYSTPDDVLGIGQIILGSKDEDDLRRRFREFGNDLGASEVAATSGWKPPRRRLDA